MIYALEEPSFVTEFRDGGWFCGAKRNDCRPFFLGEPTGVAKWTMVDFLDCICTFVLCLKS
jgi:hypothetical protein